MFALAVAGACLAWVLWQAIEGAVLDHVQMAFGNARFGRYLLQAKPGLFTRHPKLPAYRKRDPIAVCKFVFLAHCHSRKGGADATRPLDGGKNKCLVCKSSPGKDLSGHLRRIGACLR